MSTFASIAKRLPDLGGSQSLDPRLVEFHESWGWSDAGALLLGDTGAGKSTACWRLIRRLCDQADHIAAEGGSVRAVGQCNAIRWQSAAALADEARREWTCAALGKSKSATLLIFDDLGWDRGKDRTGAVEIVLAHRYDRGLPTIATSALPLAELQSCYDAQLIRRIVERRGMRGFVVDLWAKPRGDKGNA